MGAFGNTPRSFTVVTLEARKSFAFGVNFLRSADDEPVDLTGATVRLVLAQPAHQGGAVLLTEAATILDATGGESQFELQAADLDLAEGEYPFSLTLVAATGYSSPIMKGVFDVRANTDLDTTNVYAGVNPSTLVSAYLEHGDVLTVQVDTGIGIQGPQGNPGDTGSPGADGTNGVDGTDGDSAYAVAVANGFVGTEAAWLASLVGPEGPEGPQGLPGDGSVNSVNGDPGPDITLDYADVGAAPTDHTHDYAPTGNYVTSTDVTTIVKLTQAAYDALGTPVATTLYVIVG